MISQLPGLTHLLLLPTQQRDTSAGPAAAAAVQVPRPGVGLAGMTRDWQLNDAALRCVLFASVGNRDRGSSYVSGQMVCLLVLSSYI